MTHFDAVALGWICGLLHKKQKCSNFANEMCGKQAQDNKNVKQTINH